MIWSTVMWIFVLIRRKSIHQPTKSKKGLGYLMKWIWLHLIDNIFLDWKCLVAQLAVCVNVNSTVCFWCLLVSFSARGLACFPIGKKPPRRIYGGCRRAVFVFELSVFIFGTQTRRRRRFSEKEIKANCQAQNLLLFKNKVGLSTRPTKRFPPTHIWRWNEITPSVCVCCCLSSEEWKAQLAWLSFIISERAGGQDKHPKQEG